MRSLWMPLTALLFACVLGCQPTAEQGKMSRTDELVQEQEDALKLALADLQNAEQRNRHVLEKTETDIQREGLRLMLTGEDKKFPFSSYSKIFDPKKTTLKFNNQATLDEVVDNLNHWLKTSPEPPPWQADPLIESLPGSIRDIGVVYTALNQLDRLQFVREARIIAVHDGWLMQESVWFNYLARSIRKEKTTDPVEVARQLFDWTIRNIQLIPGEPGTTAEIDGRQRLVYFPHAPWQALLFGEGQAIDRAWIFTLLARQQGLDVVVLGYRPADDPRKLEFWLPALLHQGELYLFDVRFGSPVPGPAGKPIATLSDVVADPKLLEVFSLPGVDPYPVQAAELETIVAQIEATPFTLSRRVKLLQQQLAGKNELVLAVDASAIAARLEKVKHVASVRLWDHPFLYLRYISVDMTAPLVEAFDARLRPFYIPVADLWNGRVLQLKGTYTLSDNLIPDRLTDDDPLLVDNKGANQLYFEVRNRPVDVARALRDPNLSPNERASLTAVLPITEQAKRNASYWLGQIAYERGNYKLAADYFLRDVLEADPDGPWTAGARYNLGRTYELLDRNDDAIAVYRLDDSPGKRASLMRLKLLGASPEETPPATTTEEESTAVESTEASAKPAVDEAKP